MDPADLALLRRIATRVAWDHHCKKRGITVEELVNEAWIVLERLSDRRDEEKGKWTAFIWRSVRRHLTDYVLAELYGLKTTGRTIRRRGYDNLLAREYPDIEEIPDAHCSLRDGEDKEVAGFIQQGIRRAVVRLHEPYRMVIQAYLGIGEEPKSFLDIGRVLGKSARVIRMYYHEALSRLALLLELEGVAREILSLRG